MGVLQVGLIGDYNPGARAHRAIPIALALSAKELGCVVEPVWLATKSLEEISDTDLQSYAGLWCVPASPYESMPGALRGIRFAREQERPYLGTCGGFQHALIEYFRNVLGMTEADHAETNATASVPVLARMSCPLVEVEGAVRFIPGTRLAEIYGVEEAVETYHCSYGFNPRYRDLLEPGPLRISAVDGSGDIRAVELPQHPFFLATMFQPERAALKGNLNPLVTAFVRSCLS